MSILTQDAPASLVTKPKNPLGSVMSCLCGRWNDCGRTTSCDDCGRPVRSMMPTPAKGWTLYELEDMARRDYLASLAPAARQSLGLFTVQAIEDDLRAGVA